MRSLGASGESDGDPAVHEREMAIAADETMKRVNVRASILSDLLQQNLSLQPPPSQGVQGKGAVGSICPYLALCERYKDHLVVKHSMIALAPENGKCSCQQCAAEEQVMQTAGNPPQQFVLPVGWAQFMHRYVQLTEENVEGKRGSGTYKQLISYRVVNNGRKFLVCS